MKIVIEWLKEARVEIIGGLVVALIIWLCQCLYSQYGTIGVVICMSVLTMLGYILYRALGGNPKSTDAEFIELCKSGYARKVEEAIMNGANVNAKDNDGNTALSWAAYNGKTETAEILLKRGADIDATNNHSMTALMEATRKGRVYVVELLLKNGANVNAKNKYGYTALEYVAVHGHTKIAKLLKELLRKYGAK